MELKQLARQRAGVYRFLSRLFQVELDAEALKQVSAVRFPEDGPFAEAGARWNRTAAALTEHDLEALAVDFARVFLGAGLAEAAAAFPYESVYTSPKRIIMQDAWSRMHEMFANRALEIAVASSDLMEDHVSVELSYMACLCETAVTAEQAEFINLHLVNWLPQFCADVETYAETEFYGAAAALTWAYVAYDQQVLKALAAEEVEEQTADVGVPAASVEQRNSVSVAVTGAEMEEIFRRLAAEYDVYGPALSRGRGTEEEKLSVRFRKLDSFSEIVGDRQSDFSPKEVYYPISQTVFRFDESNYTPVLPEQEKPILIFAHPCDINAIRRLDNIFLKNGNHADIYYQTLRSKVKFALLECAGEHGFPGCWCVSMGTNKTDDYVLAVRMEGDSVKAEITDDVLLPFFDGAAKCDYTPRFVEKNEREAKLPRVGKVDRLQKVFDLEFWKDYNEQCISCGGCNAVCPTCSCYETADYLEQQNSRKGERKRVWASCMIPEFTRTAGGHVARPTPDKLLRFKALHKVFDYNTRFGGREHMCVGCGRCVQRCPKDIDFLNTINRLHDETERLIAEQEAQS